MLQERNKIPTSSFEQGHTILLALFGLLMPFSRILNINSVLLALLFLASIFIKYQSKNKQLSKQKDNQLWSLVLFFVVVGLSLFWTKELNTGLSVTSRIIPIILFAVSLLLIEEISKDSVKIILKYFITGSLIAVLYCFLVAFITFNKNPLPLTEGFTYFTEALEFHPSYFGVYTIFAFCAYIGLYDFNTIKKKISIGLIWLLLFVFLFFLRSRAPIIIFFFITLLIAFKNINKVASIILVFVLTILVILNYHEILATISNGRDLGMTINERLNIWMNSLYVIKENLVLGVGIGDFQTVLDKQYFLSGFEKGIDHRYNNHNQFLQTFVSNGLIGLLSLLSIFLLLFQKAIKSQYELIYYFLTCTIILMMFDSVLILQHGVYFFAFFASILLKVNYGEYEI